MTDVPPVTVDPNYFRSAFGEFAACSDAQIGNWFARASFICGDSACNVLNQTPGLLGNCLYLLTAHIGWLNAPRDGNGNPAASGAPAPAIVGRVNSASEGSVSVGSEMGDVNAGSPSQAWYMQSKYGSEYWTATGIVRMGRYYGRLRLPASPVYPYRGN
jgi:hypothetical protein